jgi:hypothetical protein
MVAEPLERQSQKDIEQAQIPVANTTKSLESSVTSTTTGAAPQAATAEPPKTLSTPKGRSESIFGWTSLPTIVLPIALWALVYLAALGAMGDSVGLVGKAFALVLVALPYFGAILLLEFISPNSVYIDMENWNWVLATYCVSAIACVIAFVVVWSVFFGGTPASTIVDIRKVPSFLGDSFSISTTRIKGTPRTQTSFDAVVQLHVMVAFGMFFVVAAIYLIWFVGDILGANKLLKGLFSSLYTVTNFG